MTVRVDQPGNEGLALAILFEVGAFGALVLAVEQLLDLAFAIDDEPGEADELAVLVERDAVDVVDQRVGVRGGGESEGKKDKQSPPAGGMGSETGEMSGFAEKA